MSNLGDRHAPQSLVEDYFARGVEGVLVVDGMPPGRLVIDPKRGVLAVRLPADGNAPDVVAFENLSVDTVLDDDRVWHQIAVGLDGNIGEAYAVLRSVLDKVQLSGRTFGKAVAEVIASLSEIIAERRALSLERQVGLFGELLVLAALVADQGPQNAISAWRGPRGEEHDFGIPPNDLEVKTTSGEKRQHWITGPSQLVPSVDRLLHLVSIQLTPAALGAGQTLPELAASVSVSAAEAGDQFRLLLEAAGYRNGDVDLYSSRWALRSTPQFYLVDELFPALTPTRLQASVPSAHRLVEVRYRLDLTGWVPIAPPFQFQGQVVGGGS